MDNRARSISEIRQLETGADMPMSQSCPIGRGLLDDDPRPRNKMRESTEDSQKPEDKDTEHSLRNKKARENEGNATDQSQAENRIRTRARSDDVINYDHQQQPSILHHFGSPSVHKTMVQSKGRDSRLPEVTPNKARASGGRKDASANAGPARANAFDLKQYSTSNSGKPPPTRQPQLADGVRRHFASPKASRNTLRKEPRTRRKHTEDRDKGFQPEDYDSLLRHISALEAENEMIKQQSNDYAAKIRVVQEHARKHAEPAQWMPDPASETSRKLETFSNNIRQWSKTWACSRTDKIEADACASYLDTISTETVDVLPKRDPGVESRYLIPLWLLLSAVVSNIAFECLLGDPFFAFHESAGTFSGGNRSSLKSVLASIEESDQAGADAWRCQLLRLLDPKSGKSDIISLTKDRARTARNEAATFLACQCTENLAHMMKSSDPHDNPTKELADIFIKGAELGWNLWVLKMRFEVSGHRSLRQLNQPNTFSFDARSEYLQADRLNAEALDNDAEALDGNEIELVVSPAVVAVDTEAEDGHGLRTVWVKAIVLVGDRRPNA